MWVIAADRLDCFRGGEGVVVVQSGVFGSQLALSLASWSSLEESRKC